MLVTLITTWLASQWQWQVDGLADRNLHPLVLARGPIVIVMTIAITHAILLRNSSMGTDAESEACGVCKWLHKMKHRALRA
jgi:hypothetical protein